MPKAIGTLVKRLSASKKWLGDLDTETASAVITAASDIVLVVSASEHGLIRDVAFGSDELQRELPADLLVGKTLAETVTEDSRQKVESLLRDAMAKSAPRWRHVNHILVDGQDVPVMYAAMQIGPRGRLLLVGRSMRNMATMQQRLIEAQRAMEREYSRLRQAETRHRLLFQVASEAVVIVDAATRKVLEANPAAARMLGGKGRTLVGRAFLESFDAASRRSVESMLGKAIGSGQAEEYPVHPAGDGDRSLRISASLFREGRLAYLLIRLLPGEMNAHLEDPQQRNKSLVLDLMENSPDGFVVTDAKGRIQLANRAFLEAIEVATEAQVRGEPLDRWLGRPGVDFSLLTSQLREHRTLRMFATSLRGEYGANTDVEICAVAVPEGPEACFGFTIREVSQRLQTERASVARPRSVEQLTELVGRVPLKELVRESTDMIERLCIEAALELTGDNRASAAELLGLSRQSLYAKLHRHGLADIGGETST